MTDAAALVRHRHWRPEPFALADASRGTAAAEDAREPGSRVRLPLIARLADGEPAAAPARPQLPRGGGAPGQPGPGEPSAPAAEPGGRAAASWSPGAQPAGECATVTLLDTGYDPAAGACASIVLSLPRSPARALGSGPLLGGTLDADAVQSD